MVATATPTLIGGAFTVTGALTFTDNTSKFGVNLVSKTTPGVTYDQVQFGGPVTLAGATLALNDAAYAPTVARGDQFWIMDGTATSSPVSGSLSYNGVALANGTTFTGPSGIPYTIFYNALGDPNGTSHDVLLSAVPEPASLGLLGLAPWACSPVGAGLR